MNDRAVSEVIGFILVFSIVIVSVGLLYTVGFGGLADIQESEQDRSGQRAFHAMAVSFEDVQNGIGHARAVDLELSGRTLTVNQSTELTASVSGGGSATASGALIYGFGSDTEIAYANGAVIRDDGGDSQVLTRAPRFRCGENSAVVSLVHITGSSTTGAISSDGSVRIEANGPTPSQSVIAAQANPGGSSTSLTIDYSSSDYATAWQQYFERQGWDTPSSTQAVCPNLDSAYVRRIPVQIEYDSGV